MSSFDSTKTDLRKLLNEVVEGKIQLPDFQRGWVWDDEHIRSLLLSIARSFPIGAIMLLETGGEARFQERAVEGILLPDHLKPERLILDGQQRLTSLTQVLKLASPVLTQDSNRRPIKRFYYFDIERALSGAQTLDEAIVGVPEDRVIRKNFGREIALDLSSREKEYEQFFFPCNRVMESDDWEYGLMSRYPGRMETYMKFRKLILDEFRSYYVPVIDLKKETSKEAVCLVFEKVNTGGVPLSVFELVTASYAADNFNLRRDWYGEGKEKGRYAKLSHKALLRDIEATDFLQGVCLLYTHERQQEDIVEGKTGKAVTPVSAKREHILSMPLSAYMRWADRFTQGLLEAEQFLRHLGFQDPKFLPYRAQIVPLSATLTMIGERWLEPKIQNSLIRWFWSGVFGELYGSASETRIALDLQGLLAWIDNPSSDPPKTVTDAVFQDTRLDSMRSRTSAAYRGLYVLIQNRGAKDFFWKAKMMELDRNEKWIDIHHIFPKKWCLDNGIPARTFNSIVNKTAISYKANRKIGGSAPSVYLEAIQNHKSVQLDDGRMDSILKSHCIEPRLLRSDNFEDFYVARRKALLGLIEDAMGKRALSGELTDVEETIDFEDQD